MENELNLNADFAYVDSQNNSYNLKKSARTNNLKRSGLGLVLLGSIIATGHLLPKNNDVNTSDLINLPSLSEVSEFVQVFNPQTYLPTTESLFGSNDGNLESKLITRDVTSKNLSEHTLNTSNVISYGNVCDGNGINKLQNYDSYKNLLNDIFLISAGVETSCIPTSKWDLELKKHITSSYDLGTISSVELDKLNSQIKFTKQTML